MCLYALYVFICFYVFCIGVYSCVYVFKKFYIGLYKFYIRVYRFHMVMVGKQNAMFRSKMSNSCSQGEYNKDKLVLYPENCGYA